ncbi:MAG TPA: mechanosensitive ion channel family protein [archaeon]|nr:mechanosensitive ion channel family protein [archaeon]
MQDFGLVTLIESSLQSVFSSFSLLLPQIIVLAIIAVIIFVAYKILTAIIRHGLKRTKRLKGDIDAVMRLWKYVFLFFAALILILGFSGNLAAAGLSLGLLSAALGWALQKPITGIAAWLMITIKKPFKAGDRVLINNIQGDIRDITMFYLELEEFGGTVAGEETSGRLIHIPTSILFDQPITNYTKGNPYVLDAIECEFTYESNLEKAEKIMKEIAKNKTREYIAKVKSKPLTRIFITANGVKVSVRYHVKVWERENTKSEITKEIYQKVMESKDLEFAYAHTEIILPKNLLKKTGNNQASLNGF